MPKLSPDNSRIAKNTGYVYLRRIFTIILAFYTSRLLLQRLGVEDFGLYGLVGSVIIMFSSLRSLFSTSVQRFINVAHGKGANEEINKIFSIGIRVHWYIAVAFIILCEVGGLIVIPTLNIPPHLIKDAYWVLHLSVLSSAITFLTVPYDAIIISFEKLNAFAIISVLEYVLRLLAVVVLVFFPHYRVIWYSAFVFLVTLTIRLANLLYCRKTFGTLAKYKKVKDPQLLRRMTSFAGWNFMGNVAFSIMTGGVNFILNIFGGVVTNAARTIAGQIMTNVQSFASELTTSFSPRSIILYTSGELKRFYSLMFLNSKVGLYVCSILGLPIVFFAESALRLWLGTVPEYSVEFTQYIFAYTIVRSLHGPIDTFFKATGDLRFYQIAEFIIMILNIPVSYIALKSGAPLYAVFVIMAIIETINLGTILLIAKGTLNFYLSGYLKQVILRVVPFLLVNSIVLGLYGHFIISKYSVISAIVHLAIGVLITALLGFVMIFSTTERSLFLNFIHLRKE